MFLVLLNFISTIDIPTIYFFIYIYTHAYIYIHMHTHTYTSVFCVYLQHVCVLSHNTKILQIRHFFFFFQRSFTWAESQQPQSTKLFRQLGWYFTTRLSYLCILEMQKEVNRFPFSSSYLWGLVNYSSICMTQILLLHWLYTSLMIKMIHNLNEKAKKSTQSLYFKKGRTEF